MESKKISPWTNGIAGVSIVAVIAGVAVGGARAQFVEPEVTVLHSHAAEVTGDGFGFVAERIGDLNRDRAPEYIIGAPFNNEAGPSAGKAYVYDGRTGQLLRTFVGVAGDQLGFAVAGVGDVDRDHVADYCIGGPGQFGAPAPNPGRVLIVSGRNHQVLFDLSGDPGSFFGYECNRGGDVNRDRRADVAVGAMLGSGFAGQVHMISGMDGSTLWTQVGADPFGLLGSAVSETLGDVNHDRIPDLVVGARRGGPSGTGAAYVLSGADGAYLDTLDPLASGGSFGWFFAHNAGDVNRDGFNDIYVGDFSDSDPGPGSGRGYVFSGSDGAPLLTFPAEAAGDGLGMGRGAGDVNGDKHDDVLVGAYLHGGTVAQGGKAYLYSGKDGTLLRTFSGSVAGAQIGFDVVTLGDVNRDRNTDFLLTGSDVAYVVAGADHDDGDDDDDDDPVGQAGREADAGDPSPVSGPTEVIRK